ncbi:hypothetical protein JKY79_01335 [Candidatus Babeliales bacterium]|nr:hypothetical protein [Candidatus Babeliales bacterium]
MIKIFPYQLKEYISFTKSWLINYFIVQIILMAVSLPFLVAWGIPFSLASIVGNLIFTPFISLFLFVSSLFFICNIFGYAPSFLIYILEVISSIWVEALTCGSPSWMVSIPHGSSLLVGLYASILIYASVTTRWHQLYKNPTHIITFALTLMIIFCFGNNFFNSYHPRLVGNKLLIDPSPDKTLKIYDTGFLSRPGSITSKVHYDLKKALTESYGLPPIEEYISDRLNKKTCKGLAELCKITEIKKIILPPLKKMPKDFWWAYYSLKRISAGTNTQIIHSRSARKTVTKMLGSSPAQKTRYTALQNGMFV